MRIIRFTAENIKKLKAVDITPTGPMVEITGPNGSGKSSVLDAIFYALAGKGTVPNAVVRKGTEHAHVTLDLGEIVVTRHFEKSGHTTLTVESEEGARFPSPQAMLDGLVGRLAFDPLEFSRSSPKEQLQVLRGLVTLDTDVDRLDRLNASDFEKRRDVNRELKASQARAAAVVVPDDAPTAFADVNALLRQMTEAAAKNDGYRVEAERRRRGAEEASTLRGKAADFRRQAEELLADAKSFEQRAADIDTELGELNPVPALIDVADLQAQIEAGQRQNEAYAIVQRRAQLDAEVARLTAESDALTAQMAERTAQKTAAIAAAAMPVEGLSFTEDEVLFNGLPLTNASDAEQLRVSIAIAMAANPNLRVLRIKDGSLLDEHSLALVAELATDKDYQVWIERVDTSGKIGVVMEDGSVSTGEN